MGGIVEWEYWPGATPLGNGRHARMMADVVLLSQGKARFTWGREVNLSHISHIREQYIEALRAADKKNYEPLLHFIRS